MPTNGTQASQPGRVISRPAPAVVSRQSSSTWLSTFLLSSFLDLSPLTCVEVLGAVVDILLALAFASDLRCEERGEAA